MDGGEETNDRRFGTWFGVFFALFSVLDGS